MKLISQVTSMMKAAAAAQATSRQNPPQLMKLILIGLECDVNLTAQYNPKEVQIEKSLTWNAGANAKDDRPQLEFASVQARTLSLELMFDTYEQETDVQDYVKKLMKLTTVMEQSANGEENKRPSLVQVQWGKPDMPIFEGVIASVSTKLTMFMPSGMPVRATCGVKIMEATRTFKKDKKKQPPRPPTAW